MDKREGLCTTGGTVSWYSHSGKRLLKKLKLPCNTAMSGLGIYPNRVTSVCQRRVHFHVFVALVTIANKKNWKTDKENVAYTDNGILFRNKNYGILSFAATWMELEDIC